jgi:RNA recognition motif-containing protein
MRLHVGNLPWDVTADDLYHLFAQHGRVEHAQVITDRARGRSRGFGFVEMPDPAQARAARAALDGLPFRRRSLSVREAHPAPPPPAAN